MRRVRVSALGAIASVFVSAGCVVPEGPNRGEEIRREFEARAESVTAELAATRADKAATRADGTTAAATVSYWLGLKAILRPQPLSPGEAAGAINRLPTLGADPELVRQAEALAEKMRAAAASACALPDAPVLHWLRLPHEAHSTVEAQLKDVVAQCRAIEGMRPALTGRYGMEFPPLDLPTPDPTQ